jgi:hypothetical protein
MGLRIWVQTHDMGVLGCGHVVLNILIITSGYLLIKPGLVGVLIVLHAILFMLNKVLVHA